MKNRKLILVLALLLSLALATGSTLAYLSDTDADVNVMTLGSVYIVQNEQERDTTGKLVEFKQGKNLYPAVYEGSSIQWAPAEEWPVPGDVAWKVVQDNPLVVDKFVTVTNTGKSPAYVRTFFAFESVQDPAKDGDYVHAVVNSIENVPNEMTKWTWLDETYEIDGSYYQIGYVTYTEPLAPQATSIPSLKQIYMDKEADNEYVETFGDEYKILVLSQAVQTDGFESAEDALTAGFPFGDDVGETIVGWFETAETGSPGGELPDGWADNNPPVFPEESVGTNEEFGDALTANKENITIELTADVTYDVAAWSANAMGGDSTKSVTIVGNGHTITFNQTNSDWNHITTNNGATLTIIDAHLTNIGHNDSAWNRHDLNFACDVTLSNVTTDKALAFKAGATLSNVSISDANNADTYAIWIQPNGQTVTLNNCTIDMISCSDGRGIKIDEQYITAQKVTLVVSNTSFKTEEKAAIIVKSKAGADITLSNVDISGVAADSVNPVWVDEATTDYADLVKVTGGTKILEP